MPRRKPSAEPAATEIASGGPTEADNAVPLDPTQGHSSQDAPAEQVRSPEPDADGERARRPWRRHLETLAAPAAGVSSGEDRQFAQVYIAFDKDRPTDEQKAKMTEAGFRYRANEKRWDAPATPVTRVAAKQLVAEFTGVALGAAQGR